MLAHCSSSDISPTVFTKHQIVALRLDRMMRKNYLGKLLVLVPLGQLCGLRERWPSGRKLLRQRIWWTTWNATLTSTSTRPDSEVWSTQQSINQICWRYLCSMKFLRSFTQAPPWDRQAAVPIAIHPKITGQVQAAIEGSKLPALPMGGKGRATAPPATWTSWEDASGVIKHGPQKS